MRVYHPHTSFFERLDLSKPPLFAFECPLHILIEPLSTPIRGISLLPVAVPSGLLNYKLALHSASAIFGFATYTVHASAIASKLALHSASAYICT